MHTRSRPGLRIIPLEGAPRDAELLTHAVQRSDPACNVLRVDSAGDFKRALEGTFIVGLP